MRATRDSSQERKIPASKVRMETVRLEWRSPGGYIPTYTTSWDEPSAESVRGRSVQDYPQDMAGDWVDEPATTELPRRPDLHARAESVSSSGEATVIDTPWIMESNSRGEPQPVRNEIQHAQNISEAKESKSKIKLGPRPTLGRAQPTLRERLGMGANFSLDTCLRILTMIGSTMPSNDTELIVRRLRLIQRLATLRGLDTSTSGMTLTLSMHSMICMVPKLMATRSSSTI